MICEKDLLEILKKENLHAYEVNTFLDEEVDIVLSKSDINEFIDFCKKSECKIVFYGYVKEEKEDYYWNEDELKEKLLEYIENRVSRNMFGSSEEIEAELLLESYDSEIYELVKKQNMELDRINWNEPVSVDIYTMYNGISVGISLHSDNEAPSEQIDNEKIIEKLLNKINEDVDSYCEQVREEHHNNWQQEREEAQKRHDEAINEIKELLKDSEELMGYTNGKLRHAYAKQLVDIYEEKYEAYLTIGEVDVLVETAYKERKNK